MATIIKQSPNQSKSLAEILEPVKAEMVELDDRLLNRISNDSRMLKNILQECFKSGGKRIRPAITFLAYKALIETIGTESKQESKVILAAEIAELIHTASLVHDDIIDNSLVRRGLETVNSKWSNAITVVSGDFMFARAAVNLGALDCNEAVCLYAKVLEELCDGEIEQVEWKYRSEVNWDYYYRKSYKKTGSLIEAAAKAPSCLLNLNQGIKDSMALYGRNIGLAFQIIDDILDYTSTEKELGKPAGSDLKEGQVTIPAFFALEELAESNPEKHQELAKAIESLNDSFGNQAKSKDEIKGIIQFCLTTIKSTKAIEKSFNKAQELIKEAKTGLSFLAESKYKQSLLEIADFIVNRKF